MRKCPACAEEIQDEAKKCRHCGEMFGQNINKETYGLDKPLSWMNLHRIKNPENYGGFKNWQNVLWVLFSVFIPIAGIILFFVANASTSQVRKVQGKMYLFLGIASCVLALISAMNK